MNIVRWRYVRQGEPIEDWKYEEPGDDIAIDEFIIGLRSGHRTPIQIQVLLIIRDEVG